MSPRGRHAADPVIVLFRDRYYLFTTWDIKGYRVSDDLFSWDDIYFCEESWKSAHQSTQCFEIDPATFTKIPGSDHILRPAKPGIDQYVGGYHRGRRELFDQTDVSGWLNSFSNEPCPEGAWVTKYNNRYYLQYATPGTVSQWYSDIVMEGDTPTGPFTESTYNPVSLKVGGFINSAGHSCVFQDKTGKWWRVTTMWIGAHDLFERRIGLFPVTFDESGHMITHTMMGDYPILRDPVAEHDNFTYLAGWHVLSFRKTMAASSVLEPFHASNASDEDVRSWWSAATGQAGEWLAMDLGETKRVMALQINFAEQDALVEAPDSTDYMAYRVYGSSDGESWSLLADRSRQKICTPHDYIELDSPEMIRHLKIENVHMARSGKFAISDLRVFGYGNVEPPPAVRTIKAQRDPHDLRNAIIEWEPVPTADGYFIQLGTTPGLLNISIQIKGGEHKSAGIHILRKDTPYWFTVSAYNSSGLSEENAQTRIPLLH